MTWEVGDTAICTSDDWATGEEHPEHAGHLYTLIAPKRGTQWKVREVGLFDLSKLEGGETGFRQYLMLHAQPDVWFTSLNFRKAEPAPPEAVVRFEREPELV